MHFNGMGYDRFYCMHVQNEGNGLHGGRTIYNSSYLNVHDLREPQDLGCGHTTLLLCQLI